MEQYVSPYVYAGNNPVLMIDPSGMWAWDYYDNQGNWLAYDGIDDNRIYFANENGDVSFGIGFLNETKFEEWNYNIKDSKLEEYMPTLFQHEGGYVNHSSDPGGATNKGITFKTFKRYSEDLLGVKPTLGNLKRLTENQASAIYEEGYWNPSGAKGISDKQIAWLYYDTYLNGGGREVLRETAKSIQVKGTIKGINMGIEKYLGKNVFYNFKSERLCRYDRIIEKNPKLSVFRKGWYRRVNRFKYK
jgi:hypothetical protein